jgi:hypothetical protein
MAIVAYLDINVIAKMKVGVVHTNCCVVAQGSNFLLCIGPAETEIP